MSGRRILSIDRITVPPNEYQASSSATQEDPGLRPEVRYAMRALHEMPPYARQREIETGRYRNFSPQEKELLRSVN